MADLTIWELQQGDSPLVAAAIHHGHAVREEVAALLALPEADRLLALEASPEQILANAIPALLAYGGIGADGQSRLIACKDRNAKTDLDSHQQARLLILAALELADPSQVEQAVRASNPRA